MDENKQDIEWNKEFVWMINKWTIVHHCIVTVTVPMISDSFSYYFIFFFMHSR